MTNMEVICRTCNRSVRMPFDTRHKRNCEPGDHSELGIDPEGEEEEELPKDRHGRVTVGDKREHSWCSVCERDVFSLSLKEHQANCREDDPSDIAVVEDGTGPVCPYCSRRTEQSEFEAHVKECAVSSHGSDYGVLEEE